MQFAALVHRQRQRSGGALDETAERMPRVADQALPEGQRKDAQRKAIHHGVPAVRVAMFHGREITLHHAVIAQGAQAADLPLADVATGGGEFLQFWCAGQLLVQRDELARFVADGVGVGAEDGRQFDRDQQFGLVGFQKTAQRRQRAHALKLHADRDQLRAAGNPGLELGTYEAGPGYALSGLNKQARMSPDEVLAQERTMKSLGGGTATLDTFLSYAREGFTLQNSARPTEE